MACANEESSCLINPVCSVTACCCGYDRGGGQSERFQQSILKPSSKAFLSLVKEQAGALMVLPAVLFARNDNQIADLAIKSQLPAIFYRRRFAEVGGLMAYGASLPELWRRVGVLVGKILNGSNPSDLPVEQPTKFELVINLKTAKQIGLTIPPNVLARADKVIK
jgi:ABC-type uncharacterized transport system substrate-binding protein